MHLLYPGILWPGVVLFTLTCYISIIFSKNNFVHSGGWRGQLPVWVKSSERAGGRVGGRACDYPAS